MSDACWLAGNEFGKEALNTLDVEAMQDACPQPDLKNVKVKPEESEEFQEWQQCMHKEMANAFDKFADEKGFRKCRTMGEDAFKVTTPWFPECKREEVEGCAHSEVKMKIDCSQPICKDKPCEE